MTKITFNKIDVIALRRKRGEWLKQVRVDAGLTQRELAELTQLTQTTISKLECARLGWSINTEIIYLASIEKHLSSATG